MINVRTLSFGALPRIFRAAPAVEKNAQAEKAKPARKGFLASFEEMMAVGISPLLNEEIRD